MNNNQEYLLKKVDQFLFKKIDALKSHSVYLKAFEQITLLDEEIKSIASQLITVILIIFPILVILYLSYSNSKIRKEIESRKSLISLTDQVMKKQKNIEKYYQYYLSNTAIPDANSIKSNIGKIAINDGLKVEKITINNFSSNEDLKNILKTKADVGFSDFTILDLSSLLHSLTKIDKLKISEVNISKNSESNLLKGTIQINHFSLFNQAEL